MKFYTRQRRTPQVIIVSLIDIFVILLIFTIVTTTFKKTNQPSLSIKLPESKSAVASETPATPVVLSISESGQLQLDDKTVTIQALKPALVELMRAKTKMQLALNADKKAPFGTVVEVIDTLREAGVKGNLSAFMESKK